MNVLDAPPAGHENASDKAAPRVVAFLSAATRVLFTSGETTWRTIVAIERSGKALGANVAVSPRWGEVMLRIDDPAAPRLEWIAATQVGVDMRKVASTNELIDRLCNDEIGFDAAQTQLAVLRHLPPVSLARFVLLTAADAAALGVIFGADRWLTLALIAFSAGAGALLRLWLAALGAILSCSLFAPLCLPASSARS
jgi:uncharacterized membrane protein YjjP (DUF1212 family)